MVLPERSTDHLAGTKSLALTWCNEISRTMPQKVLDRSNRPRPFIAKLFHDFLQVKDTCSQVILPYRKTSPIGTHSVELNRSNYVPKSATKQSNRADM